MNSTANGASAGHRACVSSRRPRWLVLATVLMLVTGLAACTRSDDSTESGSGDEDPPSGEQGPESDSEDADGSIAAGEFGDLGVVCQDGEASSASDTGVTESQIRVGTVTDKTNDASPGVNEEMYDTAVAFAAWCNEQGGINGRELVIEDLDAGLFNYADRIAEACSGDVFALVGGGAVFDDADNGQRVACGLPNIPGFVVTSGGRTADLQVQPVPNPVGQFSRQQYERVRELYPDATRFGVLWAELGGLETVHSQLVETVESTGFEVVYDRVYAAINEQGWPNFVQEMEDEEVQVVELIGEPGNMTRLLQAMQVANWYPEIITLQPNMYDDKFEAEASESVGTTTLIRSAYPDFAMLDELPALGDYVELMEAHNPEGKYPALLGAQSLSAFLLFATVATECGDDLTRQCLLDGAGAVEDWTAGGLHAPAQPGNEQSPVCGLMMEFTPDGFAYNEEITAPDDDSIYNCDPENVLDLEQ